MNLTISHFDQQSPTILMITLKSKSL